jgi:hypothetical protein
MKACYLQQQATAWSTERHSIRVARARFAMLLAALLGAAGYCPAPHAAEKADATLKDVVISATREADEQVTQQVEKPLTNDPWIYAEHISVPTENGVVRLQGIVASAAGFRARDG